MSHDEPAEDDVAVFYAATCPRLVGLLAAMSGSRADAEEVAQEAFLKLLPRWDRVRAYDDPEAWVRSVAVRMLISRDRRRRVALVHRLRMEHEMPTIVPGPDLRHHDVEAALRQLPLPQRAVVVLHYLLDLPLDRIAADLALPLGTVKSRLARARVALAPLLAEQDTSHV